MYILANSLKLNVEVKTKKKTNQLWKQITK